MTDGPDSLDALEQQVDALGERHAYASQWPLLQELRLRARRDKDFRRTVRALFMTANSSHQTLTPERQRDASVELVTLPGCLEAMLLQHVLPQRPLERPSPERRIVAELGKAVELGIDTALSVPSDSAGAVSQPESATHASRAGWYSSTVERKRG